MPRNAVAALSLAAVVILAAGLTACGGGTTSPDSEARSRPACRRSPSPTWARSRSRSRRSRSTAPACSPAARTGRLASNDIDVYVTLPSCRAADVAELASCEVVGHTTAVTARSPSS